jgi:hypothetical protein
MKRLAVLATLCLAPTLAVASDLRPGNLKLSGSTHLEFSSNETDLEDGDEGDVTQIAAGTSGYWFLTPNVGVGASLDYVRQSEDDALGDVTVTQYIVGPAVAFHLPVSERAALFGEAGIGLARMSVDFGGDLGSEDFDGDGWGIFGRGGVAFFVARAVSLDAALFFERTEWDPDGRDVTFNTLGLNLGISVYLGR